MSLISYHTIKNKQTKSLAVDRKRWLKWWTQEYWLLLLFIEKPKINFIILSLYYRHYDCKVTLTKPSPTNYFLQIGRMYFLLSWEVCWSSKYSLNLIPWYAGFGGLTNSDAGLTMVSSGGPCAVPMEILVPSLCTTLLYFPFLSICNATILIIFFPETMRPFFRNSSQTVDWSQF